MHTRVGSLFIFFLSEVTTTTIVEDGSSKQETVLHPSESKTHQVPSPPLTAAVEGTGLYTAGENSELYNFQETHMADPVQF